MGISPGTHLATQCGAYRIDLKKIPAWVFPYFPWSAQLKIRILIAPKKLFPGSKRNTRVPGSWVLERYGIYIYERLYVRRRSRWALFTHFRIKRKFSNHGLRFPEFGFRLLRSFCDTLNQLGYSLGSFLSDLKPPEQPDPRFPESRFWPFLISQIGNGPGWYIYPRGPRIKSSGSSFMMYSHLPRSFFWSESECTSLI